MQHAHDDPHRGRLTRAVGADKAEDLTGLDAEREAVESNLVAVALGQVFEL
jgi:hypothetical protein